MRPANSNSRRTSVFFCRLSARSKLRDEFASEGVSFASGDDSAGRKITIRSNVRGSFSLLRFHPVLCAGRAIAPPESGCIVALNAGNYVA